MRLPLQGQTVLSRWQSLRDRLSLAGEDEGPAAALVRGTPEFTTALTALQRLLSSRAVLDAIGIDGCGDAVRLLQQVLGQVSCGGRMQLKTLSCPPEPSCLGNCLKVHANHSGRQRHLHLHKSLVYIRVDLRMEPSPLKDGSGPQALACICAFAALNHYHCRGPSVLKGIKNVNQPMSG